MIGERHQRAAVALEPPRELEFEQNHAHGGGGASGQANKIVDRDRRRPEQCHDARAFVAGRLDGRQRRGVGSSAAAAIVSPRIGRTTVMTSAASVTSVAPCLSKSLLPSARGSSGEPGTANTSRPCSSAKRAVINEPERRGSPEILTVWSG